MSSTQKDDLRRRDFLWSTACGAATFSVGAVASSVMGQTKPADATSKPSASKPLLPAGTLGRTKHPVTLVSFGAILLSDRTGTRVLKHAIDAGVNLVHTSASYGEGKSVEACGALFKADKKYRDKVFLCVKSFHPEKESEIDEMLRDLGTDHFEVALTTFDEPKLERLEAIQAQQDKLIKKGKLRHTGFVCHGDINGVIEFVLDKAPTYFDVALLAMRLVPTPEQLAGQTADQQSQRFLDSLKVLRKRNTGILSMKSGAHKALRQGQEVFQPHVKHYLAAGADSILTSIDSFEQVEMIKKLDLADPRLTPAERQAAADFHRHHPNACLMCANCRKVCPQRLPINDLMRVRMYHTEYGWHDHARNEYMALGVDFDRLAANCGDCSACAAVCPARLAGPKTVRDVAALFA